MVIRVGTPGKMTLWLIPMTGTLAFDISRKEKWDKWNNYLGFELEVLFKWHV